MGTANQEQHPASAIKKPTDFSIDAIMRKDDAAAPADTAATAAAATASDSRQSIMFGEYIIQYIMYTYLYVLCPRKIFM